MSTKTFYNSVSFIAGLLIFIIGLLNLFRGDDSWLGVAFITLSFIYIPAANKVFKKTFGFSVHYLVKIILAAILLWISMAVGAIAEGFYPEII
ncbi:MAG: hypothetical protein HWD85_00295 [Flavobacteriaceae bacterium]|nr:hypothetical protein [Flavobacteriaceae bacterium]